MDLIGGTERRHIEIVDYDPRWPEVFREHERVIADALKDVALRVEHIGSTAVPGLAAKPIIDILVVVKDSTDERSYVPALEAAGYELRVREPEFHEHRMLRTPERSAHVHVFSTGSPEIDRYLIFRDRLRANAEERRLYESKKRALARQDWVDGNDYANAKSGVIEAIILRSRTDDLFPVGDPRGGVLQAFCEWALTEETIEGILLVGSYAAGKAGPDSDVDLIVLTDTPSAYVSRDEWLHRLGRLRQQAVEDYGAIQSVRAFFNDGCEFEFGFALPNWASTEPMDPGTRRVVGDGVVVLIDKRGRLTLLRKACTNTI